MSDQFDKVLDLAQKLNGPMVVYDKQGGKHLVILGIDEFAHYLDSGKKTPVEPMLPPNTNLSQAPEVKAESGMDESIFEPQAEIKEPVVQVLPEEEPPVITPRKQPAPASVQMSSPEWHRLGDVIRRVRPEIAPQDTPKPVPYQPHEEPVVESDEPNFLEEPNP